MIYTVFEKNVKKYEINTVRNDDTYTVLVMISTLCFNNIIMMSRFIELWYDIIEKINEIPVLIFLAAMKLMHIKYRVQHPNDRSC